MEELDALEDKIVLNSYELIIHEAIIRAEGDASSASKAQQISCDPEGKMVTLEFGHKIRHANGRSILSLKFEGSLNSNMVGFSRNAYTDANGKRKFMFSSKCEVFIKSNFDLIKGMLCATNYPLVMYFMFQANPSFDEPALKATFASTLIIPSHLTALSNMPIKSEKVLSDSESTREEDCVKDVLKRVEFEETPKMSTYASSFG